MRAWLYVGRFWFIQYPELFFEAVGDFALADGISRFYFSVDKELREIVLLAVEDVVAIQVH
jgi:hypothetical protein